MYHKTPAQPLTRPITALLTRLAVAALALGGTLAAADTAPPMPDAVPPYILEGVTPNLIITLDNSISMRQASSFEAEGLTLTENPNNLDLKSRYYSSPDFNTLYYNPFTTYSPGLDAAGNSLGDALFSAAKPDQYDNFGCPSLDLAANSYLILITERFGSTGCVTGSGWVRTEDSAFPVPYLKRGPAVYHRFDPTAEGCLPSPAAYPAGIYPPDKCFRKIEVGSAAEQADWEAPPAWADPRPSGTYSADAARTNFANWFQYYRTRALTLKTVMSRVLPYISPQVRVTWQSMHRGDFLPDSPRMLDLQARLAPFSEATRRSLYDWVVSLNMNQGTPLIYSHVRAGEFVKTPIAQADNIAAHRAGRDFALNSCGVKCRQNFHLLFTDGYWADNWEVPRESPQPPPCTPDNDCLLGANANQDGSEHALPVNPFGITDFIPAQAGTSRLFSDSNTGTLADAAFYYWRRDLWPDAPNRVPRRMPVVLPDTAETDAANFWEPRNDPASWQHLVLFPIAIGATSNVTALTDQSGRPYDGTFTINGGGRVSDDGFPGNFSSVGLGADGQPRDAHFRPEYKSDDLLHAAFNSRGQYFDSRDPDSLFQSFRQVLSSVSAAVGTSAQGSLAVSSGVLQTDTRVYQMLVNTLDWSGELRAFTVSQGTAVPAQCTGKPRGQICESIDNPRWRASAVLPAHGSRTILTRGTNGPMAFRPANFASLGEAQQRGLAGCAPNQGCNLTDAVTIQAAQNRMNWLRGDQTFEGTGATAFRIRESLLGDILSSGVESVGTPGRLYNDSGYAAFRTRHADRDEIVYVGANDGMLHGFDGRTGVERLAYVPEAIYPYLYTLTQPGYGVDPPKRAFVDGALVAADAKIGTGEGADAWRTVLVGTFGVGAQGAYALDITNPADFNEGTPSAVVLWEFTDRSGSDANNGALDGRDMGYSSAKAAVVPVTWTEGQGNTATTRWVVLLSNGYSNTNTVDEIPGDCNDAEQDHTNCTVSQTGNAVLYVLDLKGADGAAGAPANRILARLDTGQGKAQDPAGLQRANGLAQVLPVDNNGDMVVDIAYAADLFGNLWRFDLTDLTRPPRLLFKAKYPHEDAVAAGDQAQPITAPLGVARHPTGIGNLVYFGTGRFLNTEDKGDLSIQTFYAIWDAPGRDYVATAEPAAATPVIAQSQLLQQTFTANATSDPPEGQGAVQARVSSTNDINWITHRGWYIDLVTHGTRSQTAAVAEGERVITAPVVRDGRVLFNSTIPADCCDAGGRSWLTMLDAFSGKRLTSSGIDFTRDGIINVGDQVKVTGSPTNEKVVGSSIAVAGVAPSPALLAVAPGSLSMWRTDDQGKPISEGFSEISSMRNWVQLR